MIIKNIEQKIKLARTVSFLAIFLAFATIGGAFYYSYIVTKEMGKNIYVLADNTPIMALRTDLEVNRPVEYKAQVDYFHSLFFNLTPDDDFIEGNMKKAMYLIDESGIQQYRNMKEKGYYNSIISSNSVVRLMTDSIVVDLNNKTFEFYGKQIIDRKTSRLTRSLKTSGALIDIPRSENNAHGVMLSNWKTLENKDINFVERY